MYVHVLEMFLHVRVCDILASVKWLQHAIYCPHSPPQSQALWRVGVMKTLRAKTIACFQYLITTQTAAAAAAAAALFSAAAGILICSQQEVPC